jgi:hypothetical protein
MSHTPGPWTVEGESSNDGEAEVIVAENRTICWTANSWATDSDEEVISREDRANARLIAAAPELLHSLKAAVESINEACHYEDTEECAEAFASAVWFLDAVKALAKAEGSAK